MKCKKCNCQMEASVCFPGRPRNDEGWRYYYCTNKRCSRRRVPVKPGARYRSDLDRRLAELAKKPLPPPRKKGVRKTTRFPTKEDREAKSRARGNKVAAEKKRSRARKS